ncbi:MULTISPECIES: hypothetical protein [unclassified Bradyrhizobium]|nr:MULTISPECIES: hypothetical protein [unclassified Bradyrhizobium]MBR1345507.1 hypothetical protein [Bradyrhizobium sp. AUGA SZCCT0105]MBR1360141.1 hypothetical protein [Bradyrhizobium sp. AUGA SZCCT0045]
MLYQLSYCGEPFGNGLTTRHLISGMTPIGKENAVIEPHTGYLTAD